MSKNSKKLVKLERRSMKALSLIEGLIRKLREIADENNAILDRIAIRKKELDEEASIAERQKAHAFALADNFQRLITVEE